MENMSHTETRLANFPISFFSMIMGLSGLTIGWEKVQVLLGLDLGLTPWLLGTTASLFALLVLIYLLKLLLHRASVVRELRHPVKINFFPTLSMSLLLLAIAFLPVSASVSAPLWMIGSGLHLLFTLYIVSVWIHHEHFQIHHMNPAWFIPAVGNVLVPIAGVPLGYGDLSWFFFSIGILFWLILLVIVFNRVLFHHPLEAHLMPTLFILIAPPAVGFIAYLKLVGEIDSFGRILYFAGLFLTLLLFTQIPRFLGLRFFLSWWAYSFPLAAIGIASLTLFDKTKQAFYLQLGTGLVALLSGVVVVLLVQTAIAIWRRAICVADHGPAPAAQPTHPPRLFIPWLIVFALLLAFAAGVWLAMSFAPPLTSSLD
ncbi:SLAC1 anion channel family protein [Thermochromatium tepidum]|jgi:Tellurite resistance protein and related permeases|uniref:C4-dicarboxylate ABC transporter n=1 Tax=Thermochromatium tepidum ATCC 43061 TaxID=316276 RepID=A0A6I6E3U2_THETI|nr:SLAC1 anion channel family protein [Thermochromatium tepidum]QGU33615.1 C4-dicarboxylate ABC transporter [Thermochromatium tepidum ATCC 43061]